MTANVTVVEGEAQVFETDTFVIVRQDAGPIPLEGANRNGIYQIWNKETNVLELETTVLAQAIGLAVQWEMQITQAKDTWMRLSTGLQMPAAPTIAKPN